MLMSYEQATELGCNNSEGYCNPDLFNTYPQNPAPSWLYGSSNYTGSALSSDVLGIMGGVGAFEFVPYNIDFLDDIVIRPVIIISVNDIKKV